MAQTATWHNRIVATGEEAPDQLLANPRNFRIHPKHQQDALAGVLDEVGWVDDVIVNRTTGHIIDGHLRVSLALKRGERAVPVKYVELSEAEEALILATFDPISALAAQDDALLRDLLEDVQTDNAAILSLLADLLGEDVTLTEGLTDPDAVSEPPAEPTTKPGDLWRLGRHRLLCGDSTVVTDVERLMGGEEADICFTSPPYAEQRDYDKPLPPWQQLMCDVFGIVPLKDDGQLLVNLGMVHRDGEWIPYWDGWIEFMRSAGWRRFGWYVWDQGSGLPGDWNGRLAPSHEFIFHFNRVSRKANKTVETKLGGQQKTGKGLRKQDGTVGEWTHAGRLYQPTKIQDSVIRINRHSTFTEAVDHPAVFPVALADEFLKAFSSPGAIAYEPFLGGGSSLIACEQTDRTCYGMEISPAYCDVIIRRWEAFTGLHAELVTDCITRAA